MPPSSGFNGCSVWPGSNTDITNPWQTLLLVAKKKPQLHVSPSGLTAPVSLMPETSPTLFLTGHATLLLKPGPPRLERSIGVCGARSDQIVAWRTALPVTFE